MTVCVGVVTADGLVLSADSRTTLSLGEDAPQRVLSDYTHKVFHIEGCALTTYGTAFLQGRNVAGHVAEFVRTVDADCSVEELAEKVERFFGDRLQEHYDNTAAEPPQDPTAVVLGFLLGGYDDDVGKLWEVQLPSGEKLERADSVTSPGAAWRGQTDVIRRLIKGADIDNLAALAEVQGKREHLEELEDAIKGVEYVIPFKQMNLQDAIDFAVFAIRTTIDTQRLTYGFQASLGSWPGAGGPIEIAAVSPTDGFQWVQRTRLQGEKAAGEAEEV